MIFRLQTVSTIVFASVLIFAAPHSTFGSEFENLATASYQDDSIKKIEAEFRANDDLIQRIVKLSGNRSLMEELEIVGTQPTKLRQFAVDHFRSIQRLRGKSIEIRVKSLSGNLNEIEKQRLESERKQNLKQMAEKTSESVKQLETILLGHQVKRLRQICLQQQKMELSKFADEFGICLELKAELELDASQSKSLERELTQLRKEYYSSLDELKRETEKKLLNLLPKNSAAKYKELVGPHYDFEAARRESKTKPRN